MKIFSKYNLGNLELKNRIIMSPMTRSRATDNIPNDLMAKYYKQRADAERKIKIRTCFFGAD